MLRLISQNSLLSMSLIFIIEILLAIMVVFKWWYSTKETARHTDREGVGDTQEVREGGRESKKQLMEESKAHTTRGSKNKNRQQKA